MNPAAVYEHAFSTERGQDYPMVTALESALGYALDRDQMEAAARVLACPVKPHPPNWQHGRVIYALTRAYLATHPGVTDPVLLDIGTAKGYSALCLLWALRDANRKGRVISIDVIDPAARVRRNTVAEIDGLKTLREILEPWPETCSIEFVQGQSRLWLTAYPHRVHVAVVDGKHTYDAVSWDAVLLAARQQPGDRVIFDDLQIPAVDRAVSELRSYHVDRLLVTDDPARMYGLARKT